MATKTVFVVLHLALEDDHVEVVAVTSDKQRAIDLRNAHIDEMIDGPDDVDNPKYLQRIDVDIECSDGLLIWKIEQSAVR